MRYLLICLAVCAGTVCSAQSPLELLIDVNTAPKHSGNTVTRIAGKDDRIFFSAEGLWKSDGSIVGTAPVYDVINSDIPLDPAKLQVTDQLVFFEGYTSEDHSELWRSDGTQAGTFKVKDICPGECGIDILSTLVVDNILYFIEKDWSGNVALWKTDGTTAGTILLEDQITTNSSENIMKPELMAALNGNVLYMADFSLWKTGGTPGAAVVFHEHTMGCKPVIFKGELYYTAFEENLYSPVFRTDGLTKSMVKDQDGHVLQGDKNELFVHNGQTLYLLNEIEFWVSDGTDAGTRHVALPEGLRVVESVATNDKLYFTAESDAEGLELYYSDGTEGGTGMFYDSDPGSYSLEPAYLTAVGGTLYFRLDDFLYVAKNNTVSMVEADLYEPQTLTNLNGTLYFTAWHFKDGLFVSGRELWKSDGTTSGTLRITGPTGTDNSYLYMGPSRDGTSAFRAAYNDAEQNDISQLWKTDGTEATTVVIAEDVRFVFPMTVGAEKSLIYQSRDNWLYKTDADFLNPTPVTSKSIPASLLEAVELDGKIFFTASRNGTRQIWYTDGTDAGTDLIDMTSMGITFQSINGLTVHDGAVYFAADDGINGEELWKTDGTAAGTVIVSDINPGPQGSLPRNFVSLSDKLLFQAYVPGVGFELFSSDGTEAGTALLADLAPGVGSGSPLPMKIMNNVLYFSALVPETGFCLWRTDGTTAGTTVVKEVLLYADPWRRNSIVVNNTLFFVAETPESGQEIWKTDGTTEGTMMVEDLVPGEASGFPDYFTRIEEAVYFLAKSGDDGYELWKLDETHCGALKVTSNEDTRLTQVIGVAGNRLLVVADNSDVGQELFTYDVAHDGVGKLEQTLTASAPVVVTYGMTFDDLVLSSSGLPLTYSTPNSEIISIDGSSVECIGVGAATLQATQPGNNEYCPASVVIVLDVRKADQEITFEPFSGTTAAGETIALTGSASSGLPVGYSSSDESVASINGSVILVHMTGSTEITASQAGDEHYFAAEDVMQVLTIAPVTGVESGLSEPAVYPIPTEGLVFIRTNGGHAEVTVHDTSAKALMVASVTTGEYRLDLSRFPAGVYVLSVRSDGKTTHQRIVKK